ncbi:MAG: hypothetical protein HN576_14775 [Bacteriovoracaceae bacterium]|jgi:hypothetical protein|nr:hypothetical protein [Bacteriovoracaceae bacterium]
MQTKAIFQTPTTNLEASVNFYSRLGFERIECEKRNIYTDGKAVVEINNHKYARKGIKLFSNNWTSVIKELEKITPIHKTEEGYIAVDPNGVKVYLVSGEEYNISNDEKAFGLIGNFAGLSIETVDFNNSLSFWEILGYAISNGGVEQGWMTLSAGNGIDISVMKLESCPHSFSNPGLTYFNSGKNPEIIKKIREVKIPISEEINCFNDKGIVDNIIIRDPGHTLFFIFND